MHAYIGIHVTKAAGRRLGPWCKRSALLKMGRELLYVVEQVGVWSAPKAQNHLQQACKSVNTTDVTRGN